MDSTMLVYFGLRVNLRFPLGLILGGPQRPDERLRAPFLVCLKAVIALH
jgi:hypothetical protein